MRRTREYFRVSQPPLDGVSSPARVDVRRNASKMGATAEGAVDVAGDLSSPDGPEAIRSADAKFLSQTAIELFGFPPDGDIYRYTGERLRKITGDAIVMVLSFDERTRSFTCRHSEGIGKFASAVLKLIGRDPVGMEFAMLSETEAQLRGGRLNRLAKGLFSLAQEHVPEKACDAIAKVVGLKGIYTIGMTSQGVLSGMASILRTTAEDIPNYETVESFCRHAATVMRRREALDELQQTAERYRHLLENSEHLIQVVSDTGRITYVNRSWRQAMKYTESEVDRKKFHDIVQRESVEEVKNAFHQAAQGKRIENVEVRLVAGDGTAVTVRGYLDCRIVDGRPADTYGVFDLK